MKAKEEAMEKVKEYIMYIETKFEQRPKIMRVDNGGEYINKVLIAWCASKGIEIQTTAPYSPSQNGVAERYNRTLLEIGRAMMFRKGLPTYLWVEAVKHAAYLRNRAATRALNGKTPHEAWTGNKPDISHLQEFGSDIRILQEGKKLSKLAPKSRKFTFVSQRQKCERNLLVNDTWHHTSLSFTGRETARPLAITTVSTPLYDLGLTIEKLSKNAK
jgi:hypothetical protein